VGLYKICEHKGRARDRCGHTWWGSFRGRRVSLARWANREVASKAEADTVLDELRKTVRAGTFDERGLEPLPDPSPLTFSKFAEVYKQRHVLAKGLAIAGTIDYRLKPLIERFGDRPIADIRTADVEDFVADMKKPRAVNGLDDRRLAPASINRTLQLLRHMLNWAVGREYLERTPFRRGGSPNAPAARTCVRCPTASTPSPSSRTSFSSCFRRRRSPNSPAPRIRRALPGRRACSQHS